MAYRHEIVATILSFLNIAGKTSFSIGRGSSRSIFRIADDSILGRGARAEGAHGKYQFQWRRPRLPVLARHICHRRFARRSLKSGCFVLLGAIADARTVNDVGFILRLERSRRDEFAIDKSRHLVVKHLVAPSVLWTLCRR